MEKLQGAAIIYVNANNARNILSSFHIKKFVFLKENSGADILGTSAFF